MKNLSKKSGISLVALVITIIVLIILTGAVILTFMEGGIIDRAKEAVFKSDIRTYQEILALKRAENQMEIGLGEKEPEEINATTLAEIQKIILEFKEEYEGIFEISNGEIVIGSEVEEGSDYETWLKDLGIGTGGSEEAAFTHTDANNNGEYDAGEIVTHKDGDMFYVMEDGGSTLTLLAKDSIKEVQFSETNYWYKDGAIITYDLNDYEVVKEEGQEGKAYALEAAMEYGETLGAIEGRLMTIAEAESWQDGQDGVDLATKLYEAGNYWLGVAYAGSSDCVWHVRGGHEDLRDDIYVSTYGIRPVITISTSAVN